MSQREEALLKLGQYVFDNVSTIRQALLDMAERDTLSAKQLEGENDKRTALGYRRRTEVWIDVARELRTLTRIPEAPRIGEGQA